MEKFYKTLDPKYTKDQIIRKTGVVTFISFERLLNTSIKEGIGLGINEKIVGMEIDEDGIKVHIENNN